MRRAWWRTLISGNAPADVADATRGARENFALVFTAALEAHQKLEGEPLFTPGFVQSMDGIGFTPNDLAALLATMIDQSMPAYRFARAVVIFEANPTVTNMAAMDAAKAAMLSQPGIHRLP